MPAASQTNYEIRVGWFTIVSLILLLYGWTWLKSISLFNPPQRFTVQFHDVAGLTKNATVNINGVRVGVVEDLELKAKGQVMVHPKITEKNIVVPRGSHFTIQTLGLVGAKYMEVTLPENVPGQVPPEPLGPDEIVIGEDPVRTELILNEIGIFARSIVHGMKGENIGKNLGSAVKNINDSAIKFNENMDHFANAAKSITKTSDRFGEVAAESKSVVGNANKFFAKGSDLAVDMRKATQKVNKILDHPMSTTDLKEVAQKAKETADQVAVAMHELSTTLKDDNTRHDLLSMMDKMSRSTESIAQSVQTVNKLAGDKELRSDIKDAIGKAKEAISKVDNLVNKPDFQADLHDTIRQVKTTAVDVDVASKQLQQVLSKRAPLWHMLFGRPGHIKKKAVQETTTSPTPATDPSLERLQDKSPAN